MDFVGGLEGRKETDRPLPLIFACRRKPLRSFAGEASRVPVATRISRLGFWGIPPPGRICWGCRRASVPFYLGVGDE
jgi:hypothetical protein